MKLLDGPAFPFGGTEILVSQFCFEVVITDERLFPASRHRSGRVHKKLVKRYGGEFKIIQKPAVWKMRDKIIMHPTLFEELKKKCKSKSPPSPTLIRSPTTRQKARRAWTSPAQNLAWSTLARIVSSAPA